MSVGGVRQGRIVSCIFASDSILYFYHRSYRGGGGEDTKGFGSGGLTKGFGGGGLTKGFFFFGGGGLQKNPLKRTLNSDILCEFTVFLM